MPWKECVPMDEKLLFIADHLRATCSLSELCERYGISRKTGYKWIARYRQLGTDGLQEQSRKPLHNRFAISYAQRQAIIELRTTTPGQPGPKKLMAMLEQRWGTGHTPSKTTIYNILKAEGLIQSQRRRRRVHPTEQPLRPSSEPNGLWSVDYKGQFKTADGQWCYPLPSWTTPVATCWLSTFIPAPALKQPSTALSESFSSTACQAASDQTTARPLPARALQACRACPCGGYGWGLSPSASNGASPSKTAATNACTAPSSKHWAKHRQPTSKPCNYS